LLTLVPFVWLALRVWQHTQFNGYSIFYNVMGVYIWFMSTVLTMMERNCDLPSTPGRGHSILLNVFWGGALAFDTLNFVNFNSDAWYFVLHDVKDRAFLAVFVIKWLLTLIVFILGMMAPGMISAEARSQFFYRPLGESANIKYGSTSSIETALSNGATNDLAASVEQLRDQLYSGDLVLSFRDLPRQHAGATVEAAQLEENQPKNRYCNVLPYDFNRILLQRRGGATSDYINASLVVVRLPADTLGRRQATEMRYIATQGPLATTAGDFWQMVWEQRSQTIVMLTDLAEGGMTKCHQYWPNVNESIQLNNRILVSCLRSEDDRSNPMVTVREFSVIDIVTQSELDVVQLQYRGWPDFGAPKKPQAFLDFVQLVRASAPDSNGRTGPIITHCSAGIGRTGVYILVETLTQLIDRQVPINPMAIIQHLRSQRMGMIQTVEQLVFACEAGLKYFDRRRDPAGGRR